MAKTEFDELMSVGIDIGKDTYHIVGFDRDGQRVLRKQIKRLELIATFENFPRCVVCWIFGLDLTFFRPASPFYRYASRLV